MGFLSGLFHSREKPTKSTNGSAYRFLFGGSNSGKGEVIALYPLMANRMSVDCDDKGHLYYQYQMQDSDAPTLKNGTVILKPSDVLHVPGLGFDGLVGYSPIAMAKNAIGLAIATEEYGAKFFANGATPAGILQIICCRMYTYIRKLHSWRVESFFFCIV